MLRIIKRYLLMLTLLSYAGSVSAIVTETLPKAQAKHFCQLLINDGNSIAPLNYHARSLMTQEDSLTAPQNSCLPATSFSRTTGRPCASFPTLARTAPSHGMHRQTSFRRHSAQSIKNISARCFPASATRYRPVIGKPSMPISTR